jgi:hypothetical protein
MQELFYYSKLRTGKQEGFMDINQYWEDIAKQNELALRQYFVEEAIIRWHNTNEQFTLDEFICANCEYPGDWQGIVERSEQFENKIVTVTRIWSEECSFHVTSFFTLAEDKIIFLDEYWGEDGLAPDWRLEKCIGTTIQ